jgi:hypothetical protein
LFSRRTILQTSRSPASWRRPMISASLRDCFPVRVLLFLPKLRTEAMTMIKTIAPAWSWVHGYYIDSTGRSNPPVEVARAGFGLACLSQVRLSS